MIEKILGTIESQKITITGWILGFIGIFSIRFVLEALSSPASSGIIPSDPYTIIHYGLFFLCTVLATALVIGYVIQDYGKSLKLILFGLPIIWIAPLIDFVLSQGKGYKMSYIFTTGSDWVFDFFTFFGPHLTKGATYGIRIEIILILIGIGWYVWRQEKSVYKTAFAVIGSYVVGFVLATLPGIIYMLTHGGGAILSEVLSYFEKLVTSSNISHNTLREGINSVSQLRFFELGFNKLFSQILFIISVFFGGLLLWKINSKKFLAVIKNIRLERNNFYISCLFCGIGFAYLNKLGGEFVWVDLLGIICLVVAWVSLWMQAVHTNDIADVEIDKISNQERPLIKNELNEDDMKQVGNLWLSVALLGAWSAGFYPFLMSLVYVGTSYIYSVPPLRLRRFPIVPSFLISVVCLATILTGFFFVSIGKEVSNFPWLIICGIIVIVTLAINFKDLKDSEGDSLNGIMTLATIFPKNKFKIIGGLFSLSILLTPFFLSFYLLYIFAIPCAIVGYKIITKVPYKERNVFVLRYVFLACIAVSYLLIYWAVDFYNLS